jgi:hypothetical protein
MDTLIREERYVSSIGTVEQILIVQEQIRGEDRWPEKFRVRMPASLTWPETSIYGSTSREASERAIEYLLFSTPMDNERFHLHVC